MIRSGRVALGRGKTDQIRTRGRRGFGCWRVMTGDLLPACSRLHRRGGWRMRLADGLGENEAMRLAIEVENLGVAAPVHRGFKLPLHFILAEIDRKSTRLNSSHLGI